MDVSKQARTAQESWLEKLGAKFADVQLLVKGEFVEERHVNDPDTIEDTVVMSLERFKAKCAVWPTNDGNWCVFSPYRAEVKRLRYYPTREAAEMVALHNG